MFTYDFRVSDCTIRLCHPQELLLNESFRPFRTTAEKPDWVVSFHACDRLEFPQYKPICSNISFSVYAEAGGFLRRYHDHKEADRPYALGRIDAKSRTETVDYLADSHIFFSESQNSFSHIGLEELLIHRSRIILHASFIGSAWGGLLFSGVSGIGKSTQAALWARYRGSRVVNGDRALLRRDAGRWLACGWPVCGSSGICEAEDTPVRAIVMLRQGRVNHVERLSPLQAFSSLYAQITINVWNRAFAQQAMALIEALVAQAPVLLLTCDMTQDAVACLEEVVFPGAREESAMAVPGDGASAGSTPRRD